MPPDWLKCYNTRHVNTKNDTKFLCAEVFLERGRPIHKSSWRTKGRTRTFPVTKLAVPVAEVT